MAAARARRLGRIQSHDFRTAEDEPKPELIAVAVAADDAQRRHRVLADILDTRSQANARASARCFGDVYV